MYLAQYTLKIKYPNWKKYHEKFREIASLNYDTDKKLKYLAGLVTTI